MIRTGSKDSSATHTHDCPLHLTRRCSQRRKKIRKLKLESRKRKQRLAPAQWLSSVSLDVRFLIIPLAFAIIASAAPLRAMGSDWKEAPKPYFPPAALKRNSQGAVMLRVVVTKEGTVDHVVVAKSSGDRALD